MWKVLSTIMSNQTDIHFGLSSAYPKLSPSHFQLTSRIQYWASLYRRRK